MMLCFPDGKESELPYLCVPSATPALPLLGCSCSQVLLPLSAEVKPASSSCPLPFRLHLCLFSWLIPLFAESWGKTLAAHLLPIPMYCMRITHTTVCVLQPAGTAPHLLTSMQERRVAKYSTHFFITYLPSLKVQE